MDSRPENASQELAKPTRIGPIPRCWIEVNCCQTACHCAGLSCTPTTTSTTRFTSSEATARMAVRLADSRMPMMFSRPRKATAAQAHGISQGVTAGNAAEMYWKPDTDEMAPVRK